MKIKTWFAAGTAFFALSLFVCPKASAAGVVKCTFVVTALTTGGAGEPTRFVPDETPVTVVLKTDKNGTEIKTFTGKTINGLMTFDFLVPMTVPPVPTVFYSVSMDTLQATPFTGTSQIANNLAEARVVIITKIKNAKERLKLHP